MFLWRMIKAKSKRARGQSNHTGRPFGVESLEGRRVLAASNVGMISGEVYVDENSNQMNDQGEAVRDALIQIYRDADNSNTFDASIDTFVEDDRSDANGDYSFSNLSNGVYFAVQPQQSLPTANLPQGVSGPINIDGNAVQGTLIDSFVTPTGPTVDFHPAGTPTDEVHTANEAIGGQRDFTVELLTGSNFDKVELESHNNILDFNPDFGASGRYTVTWDGVDANANMLNATGLGGEDITEVNGVSGVGLGFCLTDVVFDQDNGGTIRIRVYTDAVNYSEATIISTAQGFVSTDYFIPFTGSVNGIGFTPAQGGTGADFTNVGAIQLEVSTSQATDGQLSQLGVVGPEQEVANFANPAPVPAIDIEKLTNNVQADDASQAQVIQMGEDVTWTYIVENTGDANLTNVTVTDDQEGPVTVITNRTNGNADNILEPGEIWTYTLTGTAQSGLYENQGSVNGTAPNGAVVQDTDLSHYRGEAPLIDIEKFTNGNQADNVGDGDVPTVLQGEDVVWTYQVTNIGDTDLTNVLVNDDRIGTIFTIVNQTGNNDAILNPGEVWTYQQNGTAIAGDYSNLGTVTAQSTSGQQVTDSDPSRYIGGVASIDLEKSTNNIDADVSNTGPEVFVGTQVTFTYTVRNTGTVPLTNVQVVDDNATPGDLTDDFFATFDSGDTNNDSALDTSEVWTYNASRTATLGVHENNARVTARSPNNAEVADEDPSNHTGIALPTPVSKRRFLASSFG